VDGTVCPTCDWADVSELFSGQGRLPGNEPPGRCDLDGRLAAIGPVPTHGARHDAHAFAISGLAALLTATPTSFSTSTDLS